MAGRGDAAEAEAGVAAPEGGGGEKYAAEYTGAADGAPTADDASARSASRYGWRMVEAEAVASDGRGERSGAVR